MWGIEGLWSLRLVAPALLDPEAICFALKMPLTCTPVKREVITTVFTPEQAIYIGGLGKMVGIIN